ncbi:MAG: hypothetical protein ACRDYA_01465 [Egibacteraceae bacterium]
MEPRRVQRGDGRRHGGRILHREDLVAADLGRPPGLFNAATLLQPLDADRTEEVRGAVESRRATAPTAVARCCCGAPGRHRTFAGSLVDERVLADRRLRLWVGYEGQWPVCIGTLFVDLGPAHLVLGVTLEGMRRRGCWTAMARQRPMRARRSSLA